LEFALVWKLLAELEAEARDELSVAMFELMLLALLFKVLRIC